MLLIVINVPKTEKSFIDIFKKQKQQTPTANFNKSGIFSY